MGQSWTAADSPQSLPITQAVVTARLQDAFRNAMAVGVVWPGSLDSSSTQTAGVMLWLNEDMSADGKVSWGEAGWVEYDPAAHTLRLYCVKNSLNFSQKSQARQLLTAAQWTDTSIPATFKGKSFITSRLLATNVYGAAFSLRDPDDIGGRPSVEFAIILGQNGQQEVSYGNAALRNASTPQN
jgi:hypothetical protein